MPSAASSRLTVLDEREIEEVQPPPPPHMNGSAPQQESSPPETPTVPTKAQIQAMTELTAFMHQTIQRTIATERAKDRMVMGRMNATFGAAASILSNRLHILLTLMAAFVLGMMTIEWQSWISVATLSVFCLLLLPLVRLEMAGRTTDGSQPPQG